MITYLADKDRSRFKTGDRHPKPRFNLATFAEYDPITGKEVWCSIYGNADAPFRLANLSQQRRANNTCADDRPSRTTPCRRQE
jgi:hypothetical protein